MTSPVVTRLFSKEQTAESPVGQDRTAELRARRAAAILHNILENDADSSQPINPRGSVGCASSVSPGAAVPFTPLRSPLGYESEADRSLHASRRGTYSTHGAEHGMFSARTVSSTMDVDEAEPQSDDDAESANGGIDSRVAVLCERAQTLVLQMSQAMSSPATPPTQTARQHVNAGRPPRPPSPPSAPSGAGVVGGGSQGALSSPPPGPSLAAIAKQAGQESSPPTWAQAVTMHATGSMLSPGSAEQEVGELRERVNGIEVRLDTLSSMGQNTASTEDLSCLRKQVDDMHVQIKTARDELKDAKDQINSLSQRVPVKQPGCAVQVHDHAQTQGPALKASYDPSRSVSAPMNMLRQGCGSASGNTSSTATPGESPPATARIPRILSADPSPLQTTRLSAASTGSLTPNVPTRAHVYASPMQHMSLCTVSGGRTSPLPTMHIQSAPCFSKVLPPYAYNPKSAPMADSAMPTVRGTVMVMRPAPPRAG